MDANSPPLEPALILQAIVAPLFVLGLSDQLTAIEVQKRLVAILPQCDDLSDFEADTWLLLSAIRKRCPQLLRPPSRRLSVGFCHGVLTAFDRHPASTPEKHHILARLLSQDPYGVQTPARRPPPLR